MTPTVVSVLEELYRSLASNNLEAAKGACPEAITFAVAGKSSLAGKYSKETFFSQYLTGLREYSRGGLELEIHDVLASQTHATVLLTMNIGPKDKRAQLRTVHVWRLENSKLIAGYEYPRDMYQYDSLFTKTPS